jgi:hypothetical protein
MRNQAFPTPRLLQLFVIVFVASMAKNLFGLTKTARVSGFTFFLESSL